MCSAGRDLGSPATEPDWVQANPVEISRSLRRALERPSGGWFVLDGSRRLTRRLRGGPQRYEVDGRELVVWRHAARGALIVGPGACPHMGANLADGRVDAGGCLVCPWHGRRFGRSAPDRAWQPFPVHDDGVLTWIRLCDDDRATDRPIVAPRPERAIVAVMVRTATCEPQDVIANRLDPWHGVHLHPYAFGSLRVVERTDDRLDLVVAYRVIGRFSVEVEARFTCPEPNTIVMTITAGEGAGSVVETHATPMVPADRSEGLRPRTAIIEATLVTSDRPGFRHALRLGSMIRPVVRAMAARLWVDDAAYAERRYELRRRSERSR